MKHHKSSRKSKHTSRRKTFARGHPAPSRAPRRGGGKRAKTLRRIPRPTPGGRLRLGTRTAELEHIGPETIDSRIERREVAIIGHDHVSAAAFLVDGPLSGFASTKIGFGPTALRRQPS